MDGIASIHLGAAMCRCAAVRTAEDTARALICLLVMLLNNVCETVRYLGDFTSALFMEVMLRFAYNMRTLSYIPIT